MTSYSSDECIRACANLERIARLDQQRPGFDRMFRHTYSLTFASLTLVGNAVEVGVEAMDLAESARHTIETAFDIYCTSEPTYV